MRLCEPGNALVADEDFGDHGEGVGVPHRVLRGPEHLPVSLPAEPALVPGGVMRGLRVDLWLLVLTCLKECLFVPQGLDVGVAAKLVVFLLHGRPPIA